VSAIDRKELLCRAGARNPKRRRESARNLH